MESFVVRGSIVLPCGLTVKRLCTLSEANQSRKEERSKEKSQTVCLALWRVRRFSPVSRGLSSAPPNTLAESRSTRSAFPAAYRTCLRQYHPKRAEPFRGIRPNR